MTFEYNSIIEPYSDEEIVFGTPSYMIANDFYNLYRSQLGLCQLVVTPTHIKGHVGFSEFKGLYMCQTYVSIPFYGQTPKALVKRFKSIVKFLDKQQRGTI